MEKALDLLGIHEYENGNHKLAIQHFIISAKMGWERSLKDIKQMFTKGHATKAHYATALRGYQNALEETRSCFVCLSPVGNGY